MSSSEWREVKLSEIVDTQIDNRGKNPDKYIEHSDYPVIDNYLIKNQKYPDMSKVNRYIDKENFENFLRGYLEKNDVLITLVGNGIGNVSMAPNSKSVIIQNTIGLRTNKDNCNTFLYYLLLFYQDEIKNFNRGTSQPSIKKTDLFNLIISLPPLPEQKAIAHILSTLDEKIEVNNKINKTLENIAQTIFKQWFVDFEFPNGAGEPYKSSGGEMVESELGMIPKGWEVKKVEDVTKIIRGASPRPIQDFIRHEGIPWVKISDASSSNTRFISSTKEFIKEEGRNKSREVQVGTLILSNSATPGIPMIMKIDACVHDGWLIFNEFRDITKEYMFHFLTENRVGILSLSNGSVFRNLKTDILKNYKIIVPSSDVVAKIDDIFRSINNSLDYIENQITTLTKVRDSLLPKLMSGEIRVPIEEN